MKWMVRTLVLILLILLAAGGVAHAHGHVEVGEYELVIGFRNEPAYQGEPNGLDLSVTNKRTGEKVKDLADTLKAEISFGANKREIKLRPRFGVDGAYTGDVLPTEAGDYTWRIYGDIKGTPVDIAMTSGEGKFNPVTSKDDVAFPAPDPAAAELKATAEEAAAAAQRATLLGGAGLVAGLIGLTVGVLGTRARRKDVVSTPSTQPTR